MTDLEALGAAVTIWLAVVLLSLAGDYASSVRRVPGAIPPRETVGGAQGSNTIQSVGIANDNPGDTSPAPGPLGVGSGRAALGPMSIGHPAESSVTETAARPLAPARQG